MRRENPYKHSLTRKQFYEKELLAEMPRLLSALDRCPLSSSRGSLDREYWAWATKDFSNMDLQRGLRVIAYIYSADLPGNPYFRQPAVLEWISRGIWFWLEYQDRGGSFNHLYVNEKSWMATAFTLVDLIDVYRRIGEDLAQPLMNSWLAGMEQAGACLVNRDELHGFISNHRAGAASALMCLCSITGSRVFSDRAWELINGVYQRQSSEGWFLEYEGADPGYQTLDTHYQGIFYMETASETVMDAVKKSLEFLSYFMHPDGSIGGEYGSRNCPHFFPGGFEVFAQWLPLAESLASHGVWGLATGHSAGLADSDIRNRVPLATSYVLAHQALTRKLKENKSHEEGEDVAVCGLPIDRNFERLWPEAGLYVRSDSENYLVFGASKGGVIKYFSKTNSMLLHSSCGYAGKLSNGRHVTTHLWTTGPDLRVPALTPGQEWPISATCMVESALPFFEFSTDRLMSPLKFLMFRIFNATIGRIRVVNDMVRKYLIVGRFLKKRVRVPLILMRKLKFNGIAEVQVQDEIKCIDSLKIDELREYGYMSTVYMGSAKYFRLQDLRHEWTGDDLAFRLNKEKKARKNRFIDSHVPSAKGERS